MNVCIIQARMGSTRLPGKILKDILGKPMLWHVVERCRASKRLHKVVVATTVNSEDDAVEKLAKAEEWSYYRGSSEDVLDRYYQAAKQSGADIVVRVTSDCPLIDPDIIDQCVQKLIAGNYDYVSNCMDDSSSFPRGLDVSVIRFSALEQAHRDAIEPYQREHVVPYIWDNKKIFKIGPQVIAAPNFQRTYRLTVDYPEDFQLMEEVYAALYKPGAIIHTAEALSFLDNQQEIESLNAHCEQKAYRI